MRPADLRGVIALAALVHPAHPEDDAVLAERLAIYPEGCFALDGAGGLAGYLLSHPWRLGDPPKLNRLLGALPPAPDTYYLHDLALHPAARGGGAAGRLLGAVLSGGDWPSQSLVSVGNAAPFWRHHGFVAAPGPDVAGYGAGAEYMVRRVPRAV